MNKILMRLAFIFIRILSFFPETWLRKIGKFLGIIGYKFAVARRNVGLKNLSLCFPQMPLLEKQAVIKAHFQYLLTSVLEYSLVFYASKKRIRQLVTVKNAHYIDQFYTKQPIIILCPHFVGLDLAALRLTLDYVGFTLAFKQKNAYVNSKLTWARARFMQDKGGEVFTRERGLRPVIKKLREDKQIFYYLPDQDFGEKDSVFVPFFAYKECATVSALPKLTALSNAVVIPMKVYNTESGYTLEFSAPLAAYPSHDVEHDVIVMNQEIERMVLEHLPEYYWLHKRFKTQKGIKERGLIYKEGL
jgi:Kdo2-lipid IVA lauroyltransferase/acyltransferase